MNDMCKVLSRILAIAVLLAITALVTAPAGAAQEAFPCVVDTVPGATLASAAFGLTRPELDALYGPGNAAQTGYVYEFAGFDMTLADCDLILTIDPAGRFADPAAAHDLARTLLPEDAALAGNWEFGTLQTAPQDGEEWVSATLAARYRLFGEPLTGSILVLYTYNGDSYNPGSITIIEFQAAAIPK